MSGNFYTRTVPAVYCCVAGGAESSDGEGEGEGAMLSPLRDEFSALRACNERHAQISHHVFSAHVQKGVNLGKQGHLLLQELFLGDSQRVQRLPHLFGCFLLRYKEQWTQWSSNSRDVVTAVPSSPAPFARPPLRLCNPRIQAPAQQSPPVSPPSLCSQHSHQ